MAPAIASPRNDALSEVSGEPLGELRDSVREVGRDLALRWSGQISLTRRILAINIFALLMLAGGFFYLDSYRTRVLDARAAQAAREARLVAEAVALADPGELDALVRRMATGTGTRLRLFGPDGTVRADSRTLGVRTFVLLDPDKDDRGQMVARWLDAGIDTVVGAARAPLYRERREGLRWPDVAAAAGGRVSTTIWRAPDRTPVITAAAPITGGGAVMTAVNARDVTQTVRVERFRLSMVLLITTLVSVLLSLFLARTIVRPIRRLARAAVRVRLGRAREVVVPRLPDRRDEIGMLARALSDMSLALRARIDATEAFAADLAHELKNPLASLRSAVDGLGRVRDPALQERLLAIVHDDVRRLDRLITDISEASRLDAQLSRAKFEPLDLAAMIRGLVAQRAARGVERGIRLACDVPADAIEVSAEGARLERVFDNLLDNALSFSPDDGVVAIAAMREGDDVVVRVEDEGPGVPEEAREAVFRRFNSIRPETEQFGQHSGLGLSIARTIVEGHGGTIGVESREDRMRGARFVVRLPVTDA